VLTLAAGLSTGNKIGLAVVAACFIGFALAASFLAPRRWPVFPGRNGLSVFVIACFVLFGGMLAAVLVFGREHEANAAEKAGNLGQGSTPHTIQVKETEYRIQLPALPELKGGTFTFVVHNAGQVAHDLVVSGPRLAAGKRTPLIQPGGEATLKVSLTTGNYTLYCSVDGHRGLGMVAKLSIG
jgi:uncharacterized cupredoxin-like copper-binding protein